MRCKIGVQAYTSVHMYTKPPTRGGSEVLPNGSNRDSRREEHFNAKDFIYLYTSA